MRLSISNIAWDVAADAAVAAVLKRLAIDAIDVAPGKYFPRPTSTTRSQATEVAAWWADHGVAITGLQGLLFGTSGLNLFGSTATQAAMLEHLAAVCRIAGWLGAGRLVFGSPKNRDRSGLDDQATQACAVDFFRRLGAIAAGEGVVMCLEPNPPRYGANFMTTAAETAAIVTAVGHPAIAMQLDAGALAINEEPPGETIARYAPLIAHAHASEPDLVPIGDGGARHDLVAAALQEWRPDITVCIEMLTTTADAQVAQIEGAIRVSRRAYADHDTAASRF